jgi:hypothetical protein
MAEKYILDIEAAGKLLGYINESWDVFTGEGLEEGTMLSLNDATGQWIVEIEITDAGQCAIRINQDVFAQVTENQNEEGILFRNRHPLNFPPAIPTQDPDIDGIPV